MTEYICFHQVENDPVSKAVMSITVEAVYENGVLKLSQPMPLKDLEKVRVTIVPELSWAERSSGLLKWTGQPEVLQQVAEGDDQHSGVAMTFSQIPQGAAIYLDANTLGYHFAAHAVFGPACTDLLERIELRELQGFVSTHVLSELAHRMMSLEAIDRFGWPPAGIAARLRNHPPRFPSSAPTFRPSRESRSWESRFTL